MAGTALAEAGAMRHDRLDDGSAVGLQVGDEEPQVDGRRPRWTHLAAYLRRHARSLALLLVGVVLVVPVALMWARTHPRRVPLTDDPGRHGIQHEDVEFASLLDGTTLRGWYLRAARPTGRVLVVVPGIDDNRLVSGIALRLAPGLLADGIDVLTFDLRAQGASDGDTLSFGAREQHDVLGAVAAAQARGARHVAVLGYSMGAASAVLAAARSTAIEALVLDSVFASWDATLRTELRSTWHLPGPLVDYAVFLYGLTSGTDPAAVAPAEVMPTLAGRPVLVIAGADDRTVDPADGAALAAAAGSTAAYVLVEGAGHIGAFEADPEAYAARVRSFLAEALPVERESTGPRPFPAGAPRHRGAAD